MMRASRGTGIAALLLAAWGCGGGAGPGQQGDGAALPLQPFTVGTSWTYQTSRGDGTEVSEKTATVIALEDVDGVEAAVIETRRGQKVSQVWLGEVDGRILRLREETREPGQIPELRRFEPGSLRTPATMEGLRVGQTLPSSYVEVVLDDAGTELARIDRQPAWSVEALDDQVETPAGTFGAIRLLRLGDEADGALEKRVWYAPGVGKVKEQGNRIELLKSYRSGG